MAALAVWLFVFHGETTARDYLGLEKSLPGAVSQPAAPPPVQPPAPPAEQPAPAEQAAPAEQVAPAEALPVEPTLNDVLASSAQALKDVQSFRGRFQMTMNTDGQSVNSGGDMNYQAPDKFHMTINGGGQTYEMLMLFPRAYIRIPHEGWYVFDGETMGFSPQALSAYMENRGLFDFEAEAPLLTGLAQVPDEEIDGIAYSHFKGSPTFQDLVDSLPPDFLDPDQMRLAEQMVSGPVNVDILLDKETNLPRRYTMTLNFDVNGTEISMDVRMAFTEFNGDVTIPNAPEGARPFNPPALDDAPPQTD